MGILKLIFNQLQTDKVHQELLLESLINSQMTPTLHLECIKILKEISLINDSITTLEDYLPTEETKE